MIMMMIIIIIRPHSVHKMQHIATDRVAWAVSFLFVVFVNPAKMVEPIDMPFGRGWGVADSGPKNHVLDRVQIPQGEG